MSAGKKVFTKAGEYLAEFLLKNENKKEDTSLKEVIDTLNSTNYSGPSKNFLDSFMITREQLIEYFKNELIKELNFTKITDGTKEIILQEAVQKLFNELKYIDVLTQAQFETLAELVTERMAAIFRELGLQSRKFTRNFHQLSTDIANLEKKPLDYFLGGENDKDRIYYRFSGAQLLVSNGLGNKADNFREVFRVKSIVSGVSQTLGDEISIGGTEVTSPFKKITFTKEVVATKNITMTNGAELIGTAMRARYADLAEWYSSNMEYDAGTLVQVESNPDCNFDLVIYDPNDEIGCFGIVSDKPGYILNENLETEYSKILIALNGQTPVKIDGSCYKGDLIYPSPTKIGMATAVKPKNKKEFENNNPITRCLGVCLETNPTDGIALVNCRIW